MRGAPTVRIKSADRGFPDRNFAAFRKDEHLQLKLIAVRVQSLQKRQQRKRKRTETALRIIKRDPEEKTHQRTGNAVPETAAERNFRLKSRIPRIRSSGCAKCSRETPRTSSTQCCPSASSVTTPEQPE